METLVERLYEEIHVIKAIDIHSHVRQMEPGAKSLRELLGYHYYTELAYSCGLPKDQMRDDLSDEQFITNIADAMGDFENTVQYGWIIELARKLFGFHDRHLNTENCGELNRLAAAKLGSEGWVQHVLDEANVEKVFLTNTFNEELHGFDREVFVPCLRCDDLVFNIGRPAVLEGLAARTGGAGVSDTRTLRAALATVFEYFAAHDARSAAISLPPDFTCHPVSDSAAEPLLATALRGENLSHHDQALLRSYIFYVIVENCRQFKLPVQLMIGCARDGYQHGVPKGTDVVSNQGSLTQYLDLFNRFPDVTFTVSYLSPTMAHELLTFTWIFQNVRASGHWWYTNVPGCIEPDLRSRIEALPKSKLLGYYSDAYYIEFVLPKFNMYRWSLARVLADQVAMKRFTEDEALSLASDLLRENAMDTFGL